MTKEVYPTRKWIKEDPLVRIGLILSKKDPWLLNTETGVLKNPFGVDVSRDGNTLLEKRYLKLIKESK